MFLSIFIDLPTVHAAEQQGEEKLWELNLISGIASISHYIGSDQRYTLPLIVPYLVYRGDVIQADKQGVRGRFFEKGSLSADFDFSFGLPVRNNGARQGMPDLNLVGQAGPQLNWVGYEDNQNILSLHFPWRLALDSHQTYLGWVFEPGIRFENNLDAQSPFTLAMEAELLYASEQYGEYYYGIAPQYATTTRPTYHARQGLHYASLKAGLGFRHSPSLLSGIFFSVKTLSSSIIEESPLVKTNLYFSIGVGLTWTFMTSTKTVAQ